MGHRSVPVAAALLLAVLATLTVACGDSTGSDADEFGRPPSPVPGVYAWAAGADDAVLATTDGGATWAYQRLDGDGGPTPDVAFTDSRNGWVVTNRGRVLRTANGGSTWRMCRKPDVSLWAVAGIGSDDVWAINDGEPMAFVTRTSDGGLVWKRHRLKSTADLTDIAFADERHGWITAYYAIWATDDGGATWRIQKRMDYSVLEGVTCSDAMHVWAAGWDPRDASPIVVSSSDGGRTWREGRVHDESGTPEDAAFTGITCADAKRLWASSHQGVFASTDGGVTWTKQSLPPEVSGPLHAARGYSVAAADADHVFLTTNGQPILVTADGGATWRAYGRTGFLEQALIAVSAVKAEGAY